MDDDATPSGDSGIRIRFVQAYDMEPDPAPRRLDFYQPAPAWHWDFTADYWNVGVVLMAGRDVFVLRLGFWAITGVRS